MSYVFSGILNLLLDINVRTKMSKTTKKQTLSINPILDSNAHAQYEKDRKKIFVRSIKNGAFVAFLMLGIDLVSWDLPDILNILLFAFITSFVSYIIMHIRLGIKYKIPQTYGSSFKADSPSPSFWDISNSHRDADSSLPGTTAYNTAQHFRRMSE